MSVLAALIGNDIRLQYRYGIYAAYAVVVAAWVALLLATADSELPWLWAVIIFTDPSAVGFFFLGALIMLERSEGVRSALAVAPIGAWRYLVSKTVTLTAIALVATSILAVGLHGITPDTPLLLVAVLLTSVQYIGIGMMLALRFRTVSGYLLGSAAGLTPFIAPGFLALLDPFPSWLLVIPAVSQLRLIAVTTGAADAGVGELVAALAVAVIAAIGGQWLGLRALEREIGR